MGSIASQPLSLDLNCAQQRGHPPSDRHSERGQQYCSSCSTFLYPPDIQVSPKLRAPLCHPSGAGLSVVAHVPAWPSALQQHRSPMDLKDTWRQEDGQAYSNTGKPHFCHIFQSQPTTPGPSKEEWKPARGVQQGCVGMCAGTSGQTWDSGEQAVKQHEEDGLSWG